ncbi:MAG: hypothetical protein K0A93_11600 [Desulfuromonadaceae bacterium]|nr:hypothetical protein [Desulfuromonadaceae bacterium]
MRNNKLVTGLMIVSALFFVSSALAEDITTVQGAGKINIGTSTPVKKEIGLSKGVEVRYVNPGDTAATAQWYVVASVHSGGNAGYATAQNLTNIMTTQYKPGEPTSTVLTTIPIIEASKDAWPSGPVSAWVAQ